MQNSDNVGPNEADATPEKDDPLRDALRRARRAQAERTDVVVDMRDAEIARLEVLLIELRDAVRSMPADNDQFDLALSHGSRPRLWIDMLAFVSMARDRKTYRISKDTREGRQTILESTDVDIIRERVLDYIAHRVIERQKTLDSGVEFEHNIEEPKEVVKTVIIERRSAFGSLLASFILGLAAGIAVLFGYGFLSLPG